MKLFATLLYSVSASSFQVNNFGFIPQDRPQAYTWDEAKAQCKINFGPEFELATFSDQAELDSVIGIMNNNGINDHAYWVGYTDKINPAFDGDFPWSANEPNGGDSQPCIRMNNGEFNDVECDKRHSGAAKNLQGMGVICKHSGVDYVNTDKKAKIFYCDLVQIGLMELVNGKPKEVKYMLKDCNKKRAENPKPMLKKSGGRLELDCVNCKNDDVVFSKVECQITCKADKTGNKLSAGFGCEPVYDENNEVVGSRYIFSDGFHRFQEICGGGCAEHDLHEYLGPELSSIETKANKCSIRDVHHPGSFTSKQFCEFNCPSHHDKNTELKTTNALYCKCETINENGVDKRTCNWRIKKGGFPALDATKKGEYIEPLLMGVNGDEQCKDAGYLMPDTTTSTTSTTTTTTSTTTTTTTTTTTSEAEEVDMSTWDPWGPWTEWSECSQPCGGGVRYATRPCKETICDVTHPGGVYESCQSNWSALCPSKDVRRKQSCNLLPCAADQAQQACYHDLSEFDWTWMSVGHVDDPNNEWPRSKWAEMGVFISRYNDYWYYKRHSPHLMPGSFPDGTVIQNARCQQMNLGGPYHTYDLLGKFSLLGTYPTNFGDEFYSAKCVNGVWEGELPTCNGVDGHPGYQWLMTQNAPAGLSSVESICQSSDSGAVGQIVNGECQIKKPGYVHPQYECKFQAASGSWWAPYANEASLGFTTSFPLNEDRVEPNYHTLFSSAANQFKWVEVGEDTIKLYDGYVNKYYFDLPRGGVRLTNGPNQWHIHANTYGMHEILDEAYVCRVTYKNELDQDGNPTVALGRFRLDNHYYARSERQRYDCGGLVLWSFFPKCFDKENGDQENCNSSDEDDGFFNTTINWNDYTIELLIEDTDVVSNWSNWSEWTKCSNSCGPGTKTRQIVLTGDSEEVDCLGSCADQNDSMCKPYFVRGKHLENGASPFRAVWPTRQSAGSNLVCTGDNGQATNGYWWTDLVTGDQTFMGFVGDQCTMTCSNNLEKPVFTSSLTTSQNDGTLPYDYPTHYSCANGNWNGMNDNSWGDDKYTEEAPRFGNYIKNNPDEGKCVKKYCYFTETGFDDMHAKYSHFDCSADSTQLENGDWLVPEGSFCTGRCNSGFRMASDLARLTCTSPIPFDTIDDAEYQKMLNERFDYFAGSNNVIPWGMTGDLWDAYQSGETKTVSKCYKITDQDCGAYPDYKGDENDQGVDWNCDDGLNAGSKCNKRCVNGFSYQVASWNTPKTATECFCKGTCKWLSNTTECKVKKCDGPDWYFEPDFCYDVNGNQIDKAHHDANGYFEGSYCQNGLGPENKCPVGHDQEIWQYDRGTCNCDGTGACTFSTRKINRCIQASCTPDMAHLLYYFEMGISGEFVNDHDSSDVSPIQPSVDHFDSLDCPPEAYYSGTGLAHIDGQIKPDSTCEIKCIDGFHIERHSETITCHQTFEHDFEWGVLAFTLSKYDDCYSTGVYACINFPICVPDGFKWVE